MRSQAQRHFTGINSPLWRWAVAFAVVCCNVSAGHAEDPALTARAKGDLIIGSRGILRKYCAECHGAGPTRGTINVVDHGLLVTKQSNPVPFVTPGNAAGSQIIQLIEDGSMPPGGRPRPSPEELATLKAWVTASAPPFPVAFDDHTTLQAMLADLKNQPDDAPYLRYISFGHLVRDDVPPPDLKSLQKALEDSLKDCGIRSLPQPVDEAATLFRLDTRQAGWDNRELFHQRKGDKDEVYPLSPYDLLLLDYPHGAALTAGNPLAAKLNNYFEQAQLARPIAHLRADWLAEQLKEDAPLATDLRCLSELAAGRNMLTTSRPFRGANPVPPAAKPAAGKPVLPLSAWYSGDSQAEPPPFTLKAEAIADGKVVTALVAATPFRLRVTTNRGVNFVLLLVRSDGTVELHATNMGGALPQGESMLLSKDGKGFTITSTPTGEPTATAYFVLLASQAELPEPIIVRSRHSAASPEMQRFPVTRFLFDPEVKLDSARVVRKVIPITVTLKK